jgi:hypothetical protein
MIPLVSKEFGFDQCFRNGGTVDIDEVTVAARALIVDRASYKFLSGTGRAGYQNRGVSRGHALDNGESLFIAGDWPTIMGLLRLAGLLGSNRLSYPMAELIIKTVKELSNTSV